MSVFYGVGEGGSEAEEGSEDDDDDDDDDDEEETVEGKLARLRREVEELKAEVAAREQREKRVREAKEEALAAAVAVAATAADGRQEDETGGGGDVVKAAINVSAPALDAAEGMDSRRLRHDITEISEVLTKLQSTSIELTTAPHTRVGYASTNLTRKIVSAVSSVAATTDPTDGPQIMPPSESPVQPQPQTETQSQASYTVTYAPTFRRHHALSRAADFENRITLLERLLGASQSHLASLDKQLPANAIIPTLDDLARQISVLTSTNQPFVEALNRRVKMLTEQAEKLADARRVAAKSAMTESSSGGSGNGISGTDRSSFARRATVSAALGGGGAPDDDPLSPTTPAPAPGGYASAAAALDPDRETKINALYGVLPTIEQLGPLLPSVLDRLRSLRAIHSDAGRAAEGLEGIEKRQEEMSVEIRKWREALEKVEGVMSETEGVFVGNVGKVEEWVEELEARMEKVERMAAGGGM